MDKEGFGHHLTAKDDLILLLKYAHSKPCRRSLTIFRVGWMLKLHLKKSILRHLDCAEILVSVVVARGIVTNDEAAKLCDDEISGAFLICFCGCGEIS